MDGRKGTVALSASCLAVTSSFSSSAGGAAGVGISGGGGGVPLRPSCDRNG